MAKKRKPLSLAQMCRRLAALLVVPRASAARERERDEVYHRTMRGEEPWQQETNP